MPQLIVSIDGVEIKRVNLARDVTTLGRKSHNDIVLKDMIVSGEHCRFELEGLADVYVKDLGSTNGTYVNDHMVKRQKLEHGDVISVGRARIEFRGQSDPGHTDFGQTSVMTLDGSHTLHALLRVLSGTSAGLEVPVVKAVTTFGKPGVAVVAISHRRQGFFVAVMEGGEGPLLNGAPIGREARLLSDGDELELIGTRLAFMLRE
ncbi:MAG: FHA domain-containing protein [Burkholderiaceae bacterium]|nr:FHA domain-containing protein [Burkholderiaceae bacterium]